MSKDKLPYTVDWTKWGKIRQIELSDACGLLAGIDLQAYRFMRDYYEKWERSESKSNWSMGEITSVQRQRESMAVHDRIVAKADIESVVINHIKSDCFIDSELIEISRKQAQDCSLDGFIPEDAKLFYFRYVDLPEFGSWAKATGYELPTEFPTTSQKNKAKTEGASKGGKARAAIYNGAREVCRDFAKTIREGKERGEKPSLDDCARLINEDRDQIEADHSVTLPAFGTIRDYLKTKEGQDQI